MPTLSSMRHVVNAIGEQVAAKASRIRGLMLRLDSFSEVSHGFDSWLAGDADDVRSHYATLARQLDALAAKATETAARLRANARIKVEP